MVWQIPVLVALGLGALALLWSTRGSLKRSSDARDYGSRMVDRHERRMANVKLVAALVLFVLILGVVATGLL